MKLMRVILFCICGGIIPSLTTASDSFIRPTHTKFPDNAPYSPQVAALGKMLFFDPRLSGSKNMSCATCHNPSFGWETPVALAIGGLNRPLSRHAPTVENLAEAEAFFWDGRADSLEEQAVAPLTNPKEMNAKLYEVVERLENISVYKRYFSIAFPVEGVTTATIMRAIATYERTLKSGWAPFDDWQHGRDDAISASAKRGFELFTGDANCVMCHQGWAFTDHSFHNVGIENGDPGRKGIYPAESIAFKTPSLRNIVLRAPYMHNGSKATLHDVLDHYRTGGEGQSDDIDIAPLDITDEDIVDIMSFLVTLSAYDPHVAAPALPVE